MNKETITTPQMELLIYEYFEKSTLVIVPKFSRLNAVRYDDDTKRLGYRSENIVTHECDMLMVTKNYFLREIEIKISVSDFKADFKKKHNHEGNIKQFYYAVPYYILDKIKDLVPEQAGMLVAEYNAELSDHWQLKIYKKAIDNKSATPIDEEKLNKIFRIGYLKYWFYRKREK
ncbi:MmcB family DNA repair protein [Capnocytophaga sp. Marseille-Q4570]|jgi:putative uncharacterized protein FNV0627|uniref:MmcB family DNA repair protein n=1 Tax=Capnocytophaga bilenii TaxID=2819369 RepID=A0ABS3PUE0_9FLAO|nr:MmcB family DNA repair protein [Capnocytophaga bilenii]MBO1882938.1 MmcB family DNA repair protein [Capnocytophaga bilenii]